MTTRAPALLHFVVQATVKVVVFSQGAESFALVWMAASATIPLLVFTVKVFRSAKEVNRQLKGVILAIYYLSDPWLKGDARQE